jgi:hypothetical protein
VSWVSRILNIIGGQDEQDAGYCKWVGRTAYWILLVGRMNRILDTTSEYD